MQQLDKTDKKVTRGFSITRAQMDYVREAAKRIKVSDSYIIREALDTYFRIHGEKAS